MYPGGVRIFRYDTGCSVPDRPPLHVRTGACTIPIMDKSKNIEKRGRLSYLHPAADGRLLIFGDIHGDLEALKRGVSLRRPGDLLIFLGDYADRGPEGVEVIEGINMLLSRYPESIVALKGNHEEYDEKGDPLFAPCTLVDEAERKQGSWTDFYAHTFRPFARKLSLAAILPAAALFVHGGIGIGIESAADIEGASESVERELLWSDPSPEPGISKNMRGAGSCFGPDFSSLFCEALGVHHIFRSHEPRKAAEGPSIEHGGRVVTTNATSIYGGRPFALVMHAADLVGGMSSQEISDSCVFLDL